MNVNALAGARPMQVRPGDPDAELVAAALLPLRRRAR